MIQLDQIKTNEDILRRATAGDREAQATVAETYLAAVESEIRRFHKIAEWDRDDVTQDVMLSLVRLMQVGSVLEIKLSFRALLRTIIKRRVIDRQRTHARHPDWQPVGGSDHQNLLVSMAEARR